MWLGGYTSPGVLVWMCWDNVVEGQGFKWFVGPGSPALQLYTYVKTPRTFGFMCRCCHLGRIRPGYIKRVAKEILERYGDRLSDDFDRNRAVVREVVDTSSKRVLNRIAGYLTRLKQQGI